MVEIFYSVGIYLAVCKYNCLIFRFAAYGTTSVLIIVGASWVDKFGLDGLTIVACIDFGAMRATSGIIDGWCAPGVRLLIDPHLTELYAIGFSTCGAYELEVAVGSTTTDIEDYFFLIGEGHQGAVGLNGTLVLASIVTQQF